MSVRKKINNLTDLKFQIKKAKEDYLNRFNAEEFVASKLSRDLNDFLCKCIGLGNHWGKWEVDHCNGREPAISKALEERFKDKATEIVSKALETFDISEKQLIAAIQKEYKDKLTSFAKSIAYKKAQEDAEDVVEKALLMDDVTLEREKRLKLYEELKKEFETE